MISRPLIGSIVSGLGAFIIGASSYVPWLENSTPRESSVQQFITAAATGAPESYWTSAAAPLTVMSAVGVLAALLRFRPLLGLLWVVGLLSLLLWTALRFVQYDGFGAGQLEAGIWLCLGGFIVLLVGLVIIGPRIQAVEAHLSVFDDDN